MAKLSSVVSAFVSGIGAGFVTFLGLIATRVFPAAGRFCADLAVVFFVAAFLATAFLATIFLGLAAAGVFPLAGRFLTGLAAAFFTAVFLTDAFLVAPLLAESFFIAIFDFFFGGACFAFPDLSAPCLVDLAGFALAGATFAPFAGLDADRPDFFPLALGFSRALVAIVLSLLILCGIRI